MLKNRSYQTFIDSFAHILVRKHIWPFKKKGPIGLSVHIAGMSILLNS